MEKKLLGERKRRKCVALLRRDFPWGSNLLQHRSRGKRWLGDSILQLWNVILFDGLFFSTGINVTAIVERISSATAATLIHALTTKENISFKYSLCHSII